MTIGLGGEFGPAYPGADGLKLSPFPYFDIRRGGDMPSFEAADEGAGMSLLNAGPLRFGPALNYVRARGPDDVGAPVDGVGWTLEAGAFVEAYLSPGFRLRAEGRRGINGHDGWVGDLSADAIIQASRTARFYAGPRLRLGDDNYMDSYFGVEPDAAFRTGLPAYDPGGGVHSVGGTAGFDWQFDPTWGLYGYARYDRLVGDAADSPIVRAYGSRDQFSFGLGLTYSFRIGT